MDFKDRRNTGPLVGGAILIAFGVLGLLGQLFSGFDFWGTFWPFILVAVGALFFAGMFAGGRSVAGLAIPGTIFSVIGLMMFLQNLTGYWESWSYGWTVILMSVGLGIFIMGAYAGNEHQRQAGLRLVKLGAVLFLVFGAFFEMFFNTFRLSNLLFPIVLILIGLYLVVVRSGLLGTPSSRAGTDENTPTQTGGPS